ncbi:FTR1 family protein [Arthrobacter sp. zg-Y826]|uniref:iron uptake transporter permease EfeU n=1 Tax=Arthrobacter jinronghuae TaxID=2964609 RepID=UPI002107D49C|nr:iron uptake transporter permease EfeU [Arthrobacter jinronghuae]MCQ1957941.1 FTR1 family protein [Arthrobacter jinronghuae]
MTANFLIGLREGLEAVLIVVLLLAYLRKSGRSRLIPRVYGGVGVAAAVSLAFGALLTFGPRGLTFEAQEIIGGSLSIVAVGFVTWMVFWMAQAARSLGADLRSRVDTAAQGSSWAIVLVAALAVGREGLETALFIWAAARATGQTWEPILGAALGLLVAVALGALLHKGVLKINLSRFFTWTGAALIIVAGGVLAYGIHDLQEAAVLPGLHHLAFDISHIVAPGSALGTLLKGIFNFSPATTWLEAAAWVLYVVPVMALYFRRNRRAARPVTAAPVSAGS